jgi:hypothetical protein
MRGHLVVFTELQWVSLSAAVVTLVVEKTYIQ